MLQLLVKDEAAMIELGHHLAEAMRCRGAVHLHGQLGAGKTTLCRGILRGLGHTGAVKSPTFTLVEPYQLSIGEVFHFDLYRLADPGELDYIGVDEYFGEDNLCLVEWPEKAEGQLPMHDLEIVIDVSMETRNIGIQANTAYGETVCKTLSAYYPQEQ